MTPRSLSRAWAPVLAVSLLAACTSVSEPPPPPPAASSTSPPAPSSTSSAPSSSSASPSATTVVPAVGEVVRVDAPPGKGSFLVIGSYPNVESRCVDADQPVLKARYPGDLTIRRADDGSLTLSVSLSFDAYLEGIAEVPPSWPDAALDAQAIAARSYALASTGWQGAPGETLDEPICSTTSCQVYRGLPLGATEIWKRWYAAVRRTQGLVLLYDGRPATTFYFSTSNGRTYGNEEVFGGTPLPYLRGVAERDDGASPTSRWQTKIPFRDLQRFLVAGGVWPTRTPIADVHGDGRQVTVRGGGEVRTIEGSDFRDAVNAWAPCLNPRRYPAGALPTTIPSRWMTATSKGGAMIASGRGWGHGVGMVQWGAYGKARRGRSAAQILAAYYGGFRPRPFREPGRIQVELATGLTAVRITPSARGAVMDGIELGRAPIVVRADGSS